MLRSKNAGPHDLAIDIFFQTAEFAEHIVATWKTQPEILADRLRVSTEDIHIEEIPSLAAVKITVPRGVTAGAFNDRDVLGCQQVGVVMEMDV